ncbi:MAG: hypothetical protein GW893_24280 [Armatimonadetes bacterium]|nr:hypothetical protein [Armatimonadota bacterium]
MGLRITTEVWQKGRWFVAKCPELDFVSQGASVEEAKRNLLEVIELQLEEMAALGTLEDYLVECGYVRERDSFAPQVEWVGFERSTLQVA